MGNNVNLSLIRKPGASETDPQSLTVSTGEEICTVVEISNDSKLLACGLGREVVVAIVDEKTLLKRKVRF